MFKSILKGANLSDEGDVFWVQNDDPEAYNTPGQEPKVKIETKPLEDISNTLTSAPLSIALYKIAVN